MYQSLVFLATRIILSGRESLPLSVSQLGDRIELYPKNLLWESMVLHKGTVAGSLT